MNEDLRRYIEKLLQPPHTQPGMNSVAREFSGLLQKLVEQLHHTHPLDPKDIHAIELHNHLLHEDLVTLRKLVETARRICLHPRINTIEENYRQVCREHLSDAGELEVDDDAAVSLSEDDKGAWVQMWQWVPKEDLEAMEEAIETEREPAP